MSKGLIVSCLIAACAAFVWSTTIVAQEATPAAEAPVTGTPAAESPAAETPAAETPAAETPAAETPAAEMPAAEMPAAEMPAAEMPAAEMPAAEMPAAETPAAEMPAAETPAAETPAAAPPPLAEPPAAADSPDAQETAAAPVTALSSQAAAVLYYQNGFILATTDGSHTVKLKGMVQGQYRSLDTEIGPNESEFRVRRARLGLVGNVFGDRVRYKLETALEPTSGARGTTDARMNDWFIDWYGHEALKVRAGQFKAPFNRERLIDGGRLQMVERSVANETFQIGRQIGVMLYGEAPWLISYALAAFNGNGKNQFANDSEGNMLVARIGFNPTGGNALLQSDLARSQTLHWDLGVAGYLDKDPAATGEQITGYVVDSSLRYRGFSAMLEWHGRRDERTLLDAKGWVVQAGYLVRPEWELAVRGGAVDTNEDDKWQSEYRGGINYYGGGGRHGHRCKIQFDVGLLDDEETNELDVETRVQFTASF